MFDAVRVRVSWIKNFQYMVLTTLATIGTNLIIRKLQECFQTLAKFCLKI